MEQRVYLGPDEIGGCQCSFADGTYGNNPRESNGNPKPNGNIEHRSLQPFSSAPTLYQVQKKLSEESFPPNWRFSPIHRMVTFFGSIPTTQVLRSGGISSLDNFECLYDIE